MCELLAIVGIKWIHFKISCLRLKPYAFIDNLTFDSEELSQKNFDAEIIYNFLENWERRFLEIKTHGTVTFYLQDSRTKFKQTNKN